MDVSFEFAVVNLCFAVVLVFGPMSRWTARIASRYSAATQLSKGPGQTDTAENVLVPSSRQP